jgi:predicted enzyme involved in methoxymalonyl-ACP biosynthesis
VAQITVLNWPVVLSANFEDRASDHTNHIPFTQNAFEILGEIVGSEVARMLHSGAAPAISRGSRELAAYLAGLRVRIELTMAQDADRHHVDHIIRSSASFSLTGEQPHIADSEVDAVIAKDRCIVILVSDRLADHGASGVIVYHESENALVVDWMSLSCAVLGKQVEHALVLALARMAKERGCSRVIFEYRPSARNQPIHAFLQSVAERESGSRFVLAVDEADARIGAGAVNTGAWSLNAAGLEKAARSGS